MISKKEKEIIKVILFDVGLLELKKTQDNKYYYKLIVGNLKDLLVLKGGRK